MFSLVRDVRKASAITHGGTFHADEVLSTVILKKVFKNLNLCRVLELPDNIPKNVIVYDIGGGKFDHHQGNSNRVRKNGVPYSSAGLIWREFGHRIIKKMVPNDNEYDHIDHIFRIVDRELIQGVDAIDNGELPKYDYEAQPFGFSRMISISNPIWYMDEDLESCFIKAVEIAEIVFDRVLKNAISITKAQPYVNEAIKNSKDNILVMEHRLPWQGALFSSENPKAKEILFVVYPSERGGYNWQCVPTSLGAFDQRKSVPTAWVGLKGKKFQKITGVSTAKFCHKNAFLGGAETKEDAIKLAKLAIDSK